MRKLLARFYGSTEGLVITIGLFLALAYVVSISHEAVFASPLLGALVAPLLLVYGAAGFYLWADALARLLTAVSEVFSGAMTDALSTDRT